MGYKKIIAALRCCLALGSRCENCPLDGDYQECKIDTLAADALELLTAENARLREENRAIREGCVSQEVYQAVVAERDAAVEDMRGICYLCKNAKPYKAGNLTMMTCKHLESLASIKRPNCKHFEWRGTTQKEPFFRIIWHSSSPR